MLGFSFVVSQHFYSGFSVYGLIIMLRWMAHRLTIDDEKLLHSFVSSVPGKTHMLSESPMFDLSRVMAELLFTWAGMSGIILSNLGSLCNSQGSPC